MPLDWDPDFANAIAPLWAARQAAPKLALHDVEARRERVYPLFQALLKPLPDCPDVEHTIHHVKSYDGQTIDVYRFYKKNTAPDAAPGPAIVYAHGGGKIFGYVELFVKQYALQVQETGVQLFAVDYRLAPEHRHPTPTEDCYAGLTWLHEHADEFGVDRARIATMGESAGGNLAAALAIMARDRGLSPALAKQILIYPMLDDRTTVSIPALEPFSIWTYEDNVTAWTALLGDSIGTDEVSPYAAPARVKSVEGLPPAYIDVGELDIFRDEDIAYAGRLAAANISVELHVYPGLPHSFEVFTPEIPAVKRAMADRYRAASTF